MNLSPQALSHMAAISIAGNDTEALKALSVGGVEGLGAAGQNLLREDLERVSRNALWGNSAHTAVRRVPEFQAKNYENHQYSLIKSYGDMFSGVFIGEAGRARRDMFKGVRRTLKLATMALENMATMQANLSDVGTNLGSSRPYDTNRNALTKLLMGHRSRLIWHSDTRTAAQADFAFKGVFQQHEESLADSTKYPNNPLYMPTEWCVDCRGQRLTRSIIENGVSPISDVAWGSPTDMAMAVRNMRGVKYEFQDGQIERVMLQSEDGKPVFPGIVAGGLTLLSGRLYFLQDDFIGRKFHFSEPSEEDAEWTPSEKAPLAPAAPTVAAQAAQAGSLWEAADVAGAVEIKYKLQPINSEDYMGPASPASANAVAIAGCSITVSWTPVASVAVYRVLRNSAEFPSRYYEVGRVRNTGAALSFVDKNHLIPGTDQCAAYEMALPRKLTDEGQLVQNAGDEQDNVLSWAYLGSQGAQQTLALARLGLYDAELIYMMGGIMCSQPKRLVRFINVGNRTT